MKMRKGLYDRMNKTQRQDRLNKQSRLAHILDQEGPSSRNFVDASSKDKFASTGLDTSTKFKMSNAYNVFNNSPHQQMSNPDHPGFLTGYRGGELSPLHRKISS